MKKRTIACGNTLSNVPWCLAMILLVAAANVAAQDNVQRPPGSVVRQGPPACSIADKVEVTSFTLSSSAQPLVNTGVTTKLKFRSKCPQGTADLRVPWEIRQTTGNTSTRIGSGTETLVAGATKEESTNWIAVPGSHFLYGSVTLSDGGSNNTSDDVPVTVMKEISLTHNAVQGTSAQFANNIEPGPPPNCTKLGEFNADDDSLLLNGRTGIVFAAHCQLTGGKANPEAFKNLTLKNAWTVKSAEIAERHHEDPRNAGFRQISMPSPGGTNLQTQFHVWANAGSKIYLRVLIVIRGPADKDPFR
ncbi:MAG: hypothetical protein ACR2HX_05600 [Pyrinomonadaceae bacterium]